MKNNFISPYNLPLFTEFLKRRFADIKLMTNGVALQDVQDDGICAKTLLKLKEEILLKPVELGGVEYVDCECESKIVAESELPVAHFIHQLVMPFSGDKALFSYVPEDGFSLTNREEIIVIPFSRNLTIYIDLPNFNADVAIEKARQLLNLTIQFVQSNNESVANWNTIFAEEIEQKFNERKYHVLNNFL